MMRMFVRSKAFLSVLTMVALLMAFLITPAVASETVTIGGAQVTPLVGPTLQFYGGKAFKSDSFHSTVAALPKGVVADTKHAYGYLINDTAFVYAPATGANKGSYIYVSISAGGQVNSGALIGLPDGAQVHGIVLGNGRQVIDMTLTSAGSVLGGWHEAAPGRRVALTGGPQLRPGAHLNGLNWTCLNTWLASQGIAGWLVGMVGTACSLACLTLVLCIPCIGFAMGLSAGFVSYGVYKCWSWL